MLIVRTTSDTGPDATFGPFETRDRAEQLVHQLAVTGAYRTVTVEPEGEGSYFASAAAPTFTLRLGDSDEKIEEALLRVAKTLQRRAA